MKIIIITLSISCASFLNSGWLEDAQEKASKAYESTKSYTADAYKSSKERASKAYDGTKEKYSEYNKANEEKKQAELDKCVEEFEKKLPQFGLFLQQRYMAINRRSEAKILQSYQNLNIKGISTKLQNEMDKGTITKLTNATSTIEYTNIILSELKKVQKQLKENNPDELDKLIKQTEFLMYSWTTPMEILSTKNLYNTSLLGLSNNFYKSINKDNYVNYTKFIYSMLFVNMINESILVKKDSAVEGLAKTYLGSATSGLSLILTGLPSSEDKKGLENVCKKTLNNFIDKSASDFLSENIASTLEIEKAKIEKDIKTISKNNNLFEAPMLFDKKPVKFEEVPVIDNPLNDNWYLMIREYMTLQDDFYKMKKEIDRIINILTVLPNTERNVALLKQNLFEVDALYRKFDEAVRYNIIDLPISIYADLYQIEFRKAKKWYNDDEKAMGDIAVAYNKSCANMQKYMVSEFSINEVMRITRKLKQEFNEDEWKEVKTRAKLTQDWFNMLNKVKINNK